MEAGDKPLRSQFATDDEYIEALTDWKTRRKPRQTGGGSRPKPREAEQAEVAAQWSKRQEKVMKALPDYADVIGKSEAIPAHVHQAILESDQGPQIAYFLALHPAEAKRIAQMKPLAAIKRIASLERDLADIDAEDAKPEPAKETPKPQRSKAPEPIEPVKSVPPHRPVHPARLRGIQAATTGRKRQVSQSPTEGPYGALFVWNWNRK
jgi:hypothetical protein